MLRISEMEKGQIEFLLKGGNDNTVARQFGITRQMVYKIRKKFHIPSSRTNTKRKQILELRREGTSVSKISIISGASPSYIYKILKGETRGPRVNTPDQNP